MIALEVGFVCGRTMREVNDPSLGWRDGVVWLCEGLVDMVGWLTVLLIDCVPGHECDRKMLLLELQVGLPSGSAAE